MTFDLRLRAASRAAFFHLLGSLAVAALAAVVVFLVWYPHPYGQLSGGLTLFLILVTVDVICGPLLTLVLFSPKKPRREIITDMSLVVLIQLAALAYGMHIVHQARPLFLVHEVDRFRVIAFPDFNGEHVTQALSRLDPEIRPPWTGGPVTVGIREPASREERNEVMLDSVFGGRDYAQRPEFYVPYDDAYAAKVLVRAQPLEAFIKHNPGLSDAALQMSAKTGAGEEELLFLPVVHKQDWVAVLDRSANILGFLPGDGFAVGSAPE